jgi:thiol:disulfide interchange protein DsbD
METLISRFDIYLQSSPLLALLGAFMAGIFTSFTPCVYPLIPITIGVIGAKSSKGKTESFYLSVFYVLGLALVYSSLGVFAALSGKFFGQISTNKWTYLFVGNVFLFFGLSMLDVFTLQFTFLQKLAPSSKKSGGGGFSAFIFGGISAFVAGPCTTPVIGSLLAYVASKQNILLGFSMLFLFALGMGFLLIIVGTFTGVLSSIPKSGGWMVKVKKGFGFLMIIIGEFFILKAGQLMI